MARGFLEHHDRSKVEAHVCTIRPLFTEDHVEELGNGITYHPLSLTGRPSPRMRLDAVKGVAHVIRQVQPDVLHAHGGTAWYSLPGSLVWSRGGRMLEVHDAPQSDRMSRGNQFVERFMARRLRFRVMVHSSAVRDGIVSSWKVDRDDVTVVPLGVDVDTLANATGHRHAIRRSLGIDDRVPLITYVGRLVPEKRPELFVQVAARVTARHPDAVFALVGEGSGAESARAEAARFGIADRVLLPGFIEDLAGVYGASDVFLSTSRYEGFGLAIAEAMAAGLPVVATRVGGVEDVVGDAGILEPSGDPDRLAQHVLALLEDPARRCALGRAAAERARAVLDVRETTRAFEQVYLHLGGVGS